MDCRLGQLPS
uniref:Uncharacterized protein n=1 Tax=Arundo donax TaxID=35708 RepID=A0A0A9HKY7_ARUDO